MRLIRGFVRHEVDDRYADPQYARAILFHHRVRRLQRIAREEGDRDHRPVLRRGGTPIVIDSKFSLTCPQPAAD